MSTKGLDRATFERTAFDLWSHYWGKDQAKQGEWASKITPAEMDLLWRTYQHEGSKGVTWQGIYEHLAYLRQGQAFARGPDEVRIAASAKELASAEAKDAKQPNPAAADSAAAKPDAAGVADALVKGGLDPGLAAKIAGIGAGGATNVTLWPGLSVDPDAAVYGNAPIHPDGPATSNANIGAAIAAAQGKPELSPVEQTAGEWLKGIYKMTPSELLALQQRMFDQGWYKNTKITDRSQLNGRPDPNTLEAYSEALSETARYNAAGKTTTTIDDVISMGSPSGPGSNVQGSPYSTTTPVEARQALNAAAQTEIGRDLPQDAGDKFAQGYIADESAARRELVQAQASNTTEGVSMPTLPSSAKDYVDTHYLADRIAYGAAVRQQQFFSMLKTPV